MTSVRAAVNVRYGPPERVHLTDLPDPRPAQGEILVRVGATSVNRTDCAYRAARPFFVRAATGLLRPRRTVLGTEFAGVVEERGPRVTDFAVGDRVFGYCEGRFGAHAELLTVGADSPVALVPDGWSLRDAAPATEGCHYARSALRRAGVRPGHRVLVNGATGGIGSAAVQLARTIGADVTAVCGPEHLDLVRELGAAEVVDHTAEDFTRRGGEYDVVIDAVGKSTFGRCRRILAPTGVYVSSELGPGWQNVLLALATWRRSGRRVVFPFPEMSRAVVDEIRGLLVTGAFRPVVDRAYPLEQIVAAYRYVETGRKVGNVVVTVAGQPLRG